MGVSLWALRCAYAHKVGVLRATLSLRCCASLRTGLTPTLRMPHARSYQTKSTYSELNLVSTW
ncbi:MAG: hypothetical protein NZ455_06200 [Bacteroidia bacterium]|nr:hypothetical protein [Bacteroidia bacterium]MDW8345760.1 hypothetical protein [Bacteroidia bacterium]